jgi:hypothetical protein
MQRVSGPHVRTYGDLYAVKQRTKFTSQCASAAADVLAAVYYSRRHFDYSRVPWFKSTTIFRISNSNGKMRGSCSDPAS